MSAFVIGAAGQFIFGGFWLQEGLTVFFWLRFALACLRVRMFADKGKPRRNWEKVNALVHFLLAVAVTYALNAMVIERYFN